MMLNEKPGFPLISVIIASYNYGCFIGKAIDSVLAQSYPNTELIVVDDGSVDDTHAVVARYTRVNYIYHSNRGVSASRNAGIAQAKGKFICFLDADDWLEPAGLEENYGLLRDHPGAAFVSGNYYFLTAGNDQAEAVTATVDRNHYRQFLRSNYIGMLAAVLFRKEVLDEISFDEATAACEDYELFLNISRRYPVLHHGKFIATYFHHQGGLSHRYQLMIDNIRSVISKQFIHLQDDQDRAAYREGMEQWSAYQELAERQKNIA